MKRVRCPKCNNFISFDETKYKAGQSLVFVCPDCGKEFRIRIKTAASGKTSNTNVNEKDKAAGADSVEKERGYGSITVIENMFHYKQVIPLRLGDNVIGRRQRGNTVNTPIDTSDPSVDDNHCVLTVSRDKHGRLQYVLRDGPSYTGTFVDNEILGDRERRVIHDGTLFTIGATSIILHEPEPAE